MSKEFYARLAAIQENLNAPKNQYNSFGKYKYRSCEDILEGVKPLLNGLFLSISDEVVLIGDRYYVKATATITDGENSHTASVPLAIHDEDFEKALSVLNDTLDDCGDSELGLLLALDKAGIEVRSDACRAAMLQSGNFRENKNSSTNNFREIAETSTNYPVIPSEVLSAILKVAKIRADFDDFDGDRRGIGDCLDEAEQELIVTINKYASQLAVVPVGLDERAAFNAWNNDENLPIAGVGAKNAAWLAWQARAELGRSLAVNSPVISDSWISCSERMPNDKQYVWCWGKSYGWTECDTFEGYYDWSRNKWWAVTDDGEEPASKVTHWMPLPEPPQEVNRG